MNNFVVEKYLMYATDMHKGKVVFYIVEKRNITGVTIKKITEDITETINIESIEDEFIKSNVKDLKIKAEVADIKYATKQLAALLRNEELDIVKYGDVEELYNLSSEKYHIRVVRYYYNPKGKLFEKLFNKKW